MGSEGGILSSSVVPQVQAVFPPGALLKSIRVGLQVSVGERNLTVFLIRSVSRGVSFKHLD